MTDYNIEIDVYADDGYMIVNSTSGKYVYAIDSVEGADLLSKVLGSDVSTIVYSQDEEMSLEEYEATL